MTEKQRVQGVKFSGAAAIGGMLITLLIGAVTSDWFVTDQTKFNYWFTVSIVVSALSALWAQGAWDRRCKKNATHSKETPSDD